MEKNWKKNLNAPNLLTFLRILLIPVYVIFFSKGKKFTALIVFLTASLTDLLDGFLARKYHLITDLGKLLDPLADKLMVLTVMFSLTIGNARISAAVPWSATLIVLLKEIILVLGGLLVLKRGIVVHSRMLGKVAHCGFIISLTASFFHQELAALLPAWPMTPDRILLWVDVALTLAALIDYLLINIRALRTGESW